VPVAPRVQQPTVGATLRDRGAQVGVVGHGLTSHYVHLQLAVVLHALVHAALERISGDRFDVGYVDAGAIGKSLRSGEVIRVTVFNESGWLSAPAAC
jgi:hypothetical protein